MVWSSGLMHGLTRGDAQADDSQERDIKGIGVVDVRHRFGDFAVLQGVSLDVAPGEFLTLLGPSGSGKTTLLRIIAGMVRPAEGRILIGDRDVTYVEPNKRAIGFVFQNYALFPHLTVSENVAFPLKLRHVPASEIKRRVTDSLRLVEMEAFSGRQPAHLSGGQQQRVALSRALVFNPSVLLMDEPLGSLDKRMRESLQIELRRLQRRVGITTIYVTHDQDEAFTMSDRIAVINDGVLHQVGSPQEIYLQPADTFVARFVGDLNFFHGQLLGSEVEPRIVTDRGLDMQVCTQGDTLTEGKCGLGIRPERVRVGVALSTAVRHPARVKSVIFRGNHHRVELILRSGDPIVADVVSDEDSVSSLSVGEGQEVEVGWEPSDGRVFASADRMTGKKDPETPPDPDTSPSTSRMLERYEFEPEEL